MALVTMQIFPSAADSVGLVPQRWTVAVRELVPLGWVWLADRATPGGARPTLRSPPGFTCSLLVCGWRGAVNYRLILGLDLVTVIREFMKNASSQLGHR